MRDLRKVEKEQAEKVIGFVCDTIYNLCVAISLFSRSEKISEALLGDSSPLSVVT